MRLPSGDEDGALPLNQVIRVLKEEGVIVIQDGGCYCLSKDSTLEVQYFTDPVRRRLIQHLARKFGINYLRFYYPDLDDPSLH